MLICVAHPNGMNCQFWICSLSLKSGIDKSVKLLLIGLNNFWAKCPMFQTKPTKPYDGKTPALDHGEIVSPLLALGHG